MNGKDRIRFAAGGRRLSEQALDRMIAEAKALKADAVVCLRFSTSSVMQGAAELLAYGTAVRLRKKSATPFSSAPGSPAL